MDIQKELNRMLSECKAQSKFILNHLDGITDLKEQDKILREFLKTLEFESELYKLTQHFLAVVENEIAMKEAEAHLFNEENFGNPYIPAEG